MSLLIPVLVKCQSPGDSIGDVIINLPSEPLTAMRIGIGDAITIELIAGSMVLKPIRNERPKS